MSTEDLLSIEGTSDEIIDSLSGLLEIDEKNSARLYNWIWANQSVFEGNENVASVADPLREGNGAANFLTSDASYHINIKYVTLALACLILDIKITHGFANFLLGFYGVDYSRVRLESFEKCVAYEINIAKKISRDELPQLKSCNYAQFVNYRCDWLNKDQTCRKWNESELKEIIDSLLLKRVIKEECGSYGIIF